MKIYQVDYEEETIISKFVDTDTIGELDENQFITELESDNALGIPYIVKGQDD